MRPAIGRVFSPEEDDRVYKGHPSVVLSHEYWVTRFAADPKVIGQKILVNNYPDDHCRRIRAGLHGLDPARSPQIRIPIQMKPLMTPGWDEIGDRRSQWIQMFARMKPGFTVDSAQASLQPLFTQILREELTQPELKDISPYNRDRFLERKVHVEPAANGYSQMRRDYSTALTVLMCMVALVLLIACFNVANLMIARAISRQKEVAVRLAVGASRWQLLRQLLIESLVLSLAGGVVGLFLSVAIIRGLLHFLPGRFLHADAARGAGPAHPGLQWRARAAHRRALRPGPGAAIPQGGPVEHAQGRGRRGLRRRRLGQAAQDAGHRAGGVFLPPAGRVRTLRAHPDQFEADQRRLPRPSTTW